MRAVMPEDAYLAAIGRATYSIAYAEWLVIEVARYLDSSLTVGWLAKRTTGTIATRFKAAVYAGSIPNAELRTTLETIADDWHSLVGPRNDFAHARPATAGDGSQRLYRWAPGVTPRLITEDFLADLSARALAIASRLAPLRDQLGC